MNSPADHGEDLSFEGTLGALLGLIGESVTVRMTVGGRGEPSITACFMEGVLTRAMNRGPAVMPALGAGPDEWNAHDAHFFVVGNEGTGFYLAPQVFKVARWLSPTKHDLWVEQGPYLVISVIASGRLGS